MNAASDIPSAVPLFSVAGALTGVQPPPAPRVLVRYFTDPLSAWCWGLEPAWLRLGETFGGLIALELRMAGLIQSIEEVTGSDSAFHRPDQIAMQWDEAAHFTGMPMASDLWLTSPPSSSWPACAAVKAAQRQDPVKGERYLRRVREAGMFEGLDVSDAALLERLAAEAELDAARFGQDLESGAAGDALAEDLGLAAELGAVSTPSFFLEGPGGRVALRGSRPFEDLVGALEEAHGGPVPGVNPWSLTDRSAYLRALVDARGSITAAEAAEVVGLERGDVRDLLDRMSSAGAFRRAVTDAGVLYRRA